MPRRCSITSEPPHGSRPRQSDRRFQAFPQHASRRSSPRCAGPRAECPRCGHDHGWALRGKAHTFECARCHRQTSVTAGTTGQQASALTVWFWAAYLMATHERDRGAAAVQNQLGIGLSQRLALSAKAQSHGDPERVAVGLIGSTRPRWRSAPRMSGRRRRAQPRRQAARSATATRRAACAMAEQSYGAESLPSFWSSAAKCVAITPETRR